MDQDSSPVSHVDLYHKLGKLEGLMQTMTSSMSAFQSAIMDLHGRIDALEKRQSELENKRSSEKGATSALTTLGKDFAIPIAAIFIAWLVGKGQVSQDLRLQDPQHIPGTSQHNTQSR